MDIKESFDDPAEFVENLTSDEWEELESHSTQNAQGLVSNDLSLDEIGNLLATTWLAGAAWAEQDGIEKEEDGLIHIALDQRQAKNLIEFFLGVEIK